MRKILWVGDAACDSGFAKATHHTLKSFVNDARFDQHGPQWVVTVLGLNYRGDPHAYPYRIYPAYVPGGDMFGTRRVVEIVMRERPDVVVFQNDPWNIPAYVVKLKDMPSKPKLVGAIAVDGKNCRGKDLNGLDHAIFWTQFAQDEATQGGMTIESSIVPLGVDVTKYAPGDRHEAREKLGLFSSIPAMTDDSLIFLNVNRNQPRKRLDLTLEYFAEYYHSSRDDAYLYLHVCPTGDVGYDIDQLAKYYNLKGRVLLAQPGVYHGVSEEEMILTYRAADVGISTTQGEGWGLTTMEGMACGLPQIIPDWAALGEWPAPVARQIPCSSTCVTPNMINVIGGVPDRKEFVNAMHQYARWKPLREKKSHDGIALMRQDQYRWENIAAAFRTVVETLA